MNKTPQPAEHDLADGVDFIVRSAEQPALQLLHWDDATLNRVFGPEPTENE